MWKRPSDNWGREEQNRLSPIFSRHFFFFFVFENIHAILNESMNLLVSKNLLLPSVILTSGFSDQVPVVELWKLGKARSLWNDLQTNLRIQRTWRFYSYHIRLRQRDVEEGLILWTAPESIFKIVGCFSWYAFKFQYDAVMGPRFWKILFLFS